MDSFLLPEDNLSTNNTANIVILFKPPKLFSEKISK